MNPAQLLAHFDRISEAPDAVARLRRFVLDLAVRGKLVEQDPRDEPAAELLKRIRAEKARMSKRLQDVSEVDHLEDWDALPSGWDVVPLISLGIWAIGSGFPKNEQGLSDGPHFFLKVSDMNLPGNERYITTSNNFIDDAAAGRMRAKIHPPGTIIFPKIGGAIATNKRRILTKGSAIDNNCLGITFSSEVDTEWAYLLLTTLDFTQYQAGTAVPALQQGVLERIPVGLPPLAEQHRIVAKVDELMALCDQLEAAKNEREARRDHLVAASLHRIGNVAHPSTSSGRTDQAAGEESVRAEPVEALAAAARFHLNHLPRLTTRPEHIKQLRQTILNLAVRGQLVPQDPNDEPAAELLKQLKVQIDKFKTDLDSQSIPATWEWVTIEQIATVSSGTTPSREVPEYYVSVGTPWVTSGETNNAFITQTTQHISERAMNETNLKLYPSGTLIVAMYGQGKTRGQIAELCIEATTNQACAAIVLKLDGTAHRRYVKLYFQKIYEEIRGLAAGGAQPNLNGGKIKSMKLPLPPLAEQHRIVAKVDELMALCDQLEAQLTTTQTDSRRLLEAVLRDALAPAPTLEEAAA